MTEVQDQRPGKRKSAFRRDSAALKISSPTRPKFTPPGRGNRAAARPRPFGIKSRNALKPLPSSKRPKTNPYASAHRNVISLGEASRQSEKKRAVRRVVLVRTAQVLSVVLVLSGLIWLICFSSILAYQARNTRVMGGNDAVGGAEVKKLLQPYVGTPLVRIPTSQLEQSITRSSPWIKQTEVSRELPQGLVVKLTLRQVWGQTAQGKLLGEDGVLIPPTGALPDKNTLPVVESKCPAKNQTKCLAQGAAVAKELVPELRKKVKVVQVTRLENITLQLENGAQAIWGSPVQSDKKTAVLTLLIAQRGAKIYNVSDYAHPIIGN